MHIEDKLSQMGLTLPAPGPPVGNYVGAVRVGNLLFVSGHGPRRQWKYRSDRCHGAVARW